MAYPILDQRSPQNTGDSELLFARRQPEPSNNPAPQARVQTVDPELERIRQEAQAFGQRLVASRNDPVRLSTPRQGINNPQGGPSGSTGSTRQRGATTGGGGNGSA